MTPKMRPKFDFSVKYDPSLFPSIGRWLPAFLSISYISPGEPINGLTVYALNMK
jgi:hypothetical protein